MGVSANQLEGFLAGFPSVLVMTKNVLGSTPREKGAWMLVGDDKLLGTIGGGQLEFIAIDTARQMLRSGDKVREIDVPLGPEIGQCCGGRVGISLVFVSQEIGNDLLARLKTETQNLPCVYIMGAGHVGRALAIALMPLPVKTIIVDTREEALQDLSAEIEMRLSALPEAEVRSAPAQSSFIVLTHDHALDFLIAREALLRGDAAYVGMIGSKTKRAAFLAWMKKEGAPQGVEKSLVCPIGGDKLADKRPEVIAALVAAEALVHIGQRKKTVPDEIDQIGEMVGEKSWQMN